jgi:pimeloyl-ACP methyl ester carboxylesterase
MRAMRWIVLSCCCVALWGRAATYDCEIKPKAADNFLVAQFRLWLPETAEKLRGALVLVPGYNGNGLSLVNNPAWQDLAQQHQLALIGCHLKGDKQDLYCRAERGSGAALLKAVDQLGQMSQHPELAGTALAIWGHSAGGQFGYNVACWKPKRVIGFVAIKGGYSYANATPALRKVPSLIIAGENDKPERIHNLTKLFTGNRQLGALWGFVMEPNAGHDLGQTQQVTLPFLNAVIARRLSSNAAPASAAVTLKELTPESGWLGDLKTHAIEPFIKYKAAKNKAAWLPDQATAEAWQALHKGNQ